MLAIDCLGFSKSGSHRPHMSVVRRVSFRSDRIDQWTALRLRACESGAIYLASEKRAKRWARNLSAEPIG